MKNETFKTLLPLAETERLARVTNFDNQGIKALADELGLETKRVKRDRLEAAVLQTLEYIQPTKTNKDNSKNMKKENGKKNKQKAASANAATDTDASASAVATAETAAPAVPKKRGRKAKGATSEETFVSSGADANGQEGANGTDGAVAELVYEADENLPQDNEPVFATDGDSVASNDDVSAVTDSDADAIEAAAVESESTALALVGNQLPTVDGEAFDVLSDDESAERTQLENTVKENLDGFLKSSFEIGGALTQINIKRLYRSTHNSFEAYVMEQFGISRPHAYQLMTAGAIYEAIHDDRVEQEVLPSIRASLMVSRNVQHLLPTDASQREVEGYGRAATRFVWQLIVETAPKGKDGKPNITPAHLDSVFVTLRSFVKDGVIEIDGEQMPLTVAQAAFDEQVTAKLSSNQNRTFGRVRYKLPQNNG